MMLAKEIKRIVSVLLGSAKFESVVWLGYVVWMLKIFDTLIIKGSTYSHKVPRRKTANPKMHQFGSLDPEKAKKTHMTYIWLRLKKNHIFFNLFHISVEDDILRGPEVGLRVRRGPDWEWQDQEPGGYSSWITGD